MTDLSSQLTSNPVASALIPNDPFTGSATVENKWLTGTRSGSNGAVLTAGTNTSAAASGGINGVGSPTIDQAPDGALRLTSAATNQGSYAIYNSPIAAGSGLNITFEFFSYGGTPFKAGDSGGGDGISFFLIDGATAAPSIGGFGGSLGYANRTPNAGGAAEAGLTGGYVGIGFDEYGNYVTSTEGRNGGVGTTAVANSIGVRGSAANNYQYLTSGVAPGALDSLTSNTRTTAKRTANIDISAAGILTVNVDIDGDGKFTSKGEVVISSYNLVANNGKLPDNFKFGFAASTGGSTNIHEIRNLKVDISSATPPTTAIKPDLLWRNTTTVPDQTYIWYIDDTGAAPVFTGGGQITNSNGVVDDRPGKDWQVKATADFGGSSKTDILWRNKVTDETAVWLMDGIVSTTRLYVLPTVKPGTSWDIVGVGQFKGANGPLGIVWQDSNTGEAAIWEWDAAAKAVNVVNGGTDYVQDNGVRNKPGTAWKIEGVGDYDGDGISDILWRNGSSVAVWGMGGATGTTLVKNYGVLAQTLAPTFKSVGSAKFNADGTTDVIYRDDANDRTVIWTMSKTGTTLSATQLEFSVKPGSTWRIQGLADFTNDGFTDIVWRNTATTGDGALQAAIWALDGVGATRKAAGTGYITTTATVNNTLTPAASWNVVGTGEFGG
jgi:FG-GAP-like repeat